MEELWNIIEEVLDFLNISLPLYQSEEGITLTISPVRLLGIFFLMIIGRIAVRRFIKILDQAEVSQKLMEDSQRRKIILRIIKFFIYASVAILSLYLIGLKPYVILDSINTFLNYSLDFGGGAKDEQGKIKSPKVSISIGRILLIFILFYLARLSIRFTTSYLDQSEVSKRFMHDAGRRKAILQIFSYVIYVFILIICLSIIGFEPTILLTGATALLVGVGLALQHTIDDVFSGILLLFEGTIEVGDVVEIDDLNIEGKVQEIRLRTSIIETKDSVSIIIPNSNLTSNNVINRNFNDKETRFRVKIGVAYGSDLNIVRKILKECALNHGLVLKKPEPTILFKEFGDSSLNFELLCWTTQSFETERIRSDLFFAIEAEFRRKNVVIPFPQRDIHIVSDIRMVNGSQSTPSSSDTGNSNIP